MKMLPYFLFGLAASAAVLASRAEAECVCACVNGRVQAVCSSALDLEPVCMPRICPIPLPSIKPLPRLDLPPLGASDCEWAQVLDEDTGLYEYRWVCE